MAIFIFLKCTSDFCHFAQKFWRVKPFSKNIFRRPQTNNNNSSGNGNGDCNVNGNSSGNVNGCPTMTNSIIRFCEIEDVLTKMFLTKSLLLLLFGDDVHNTQQHFTATHNDIERKRKLSFKKGRIRKK